MFAVVSQITKRRQTFHNSCRTGAASSGRIRNNSVQIWRAVRYEVKRFCTELKFATPPPLLKYVFLSRYLYFKMDPVHPLAFEGLDGAALQATRSRRDMSIQACL